MRWLKRRLARWVLRDINMIEFYGALPRVQPGHGGYTHMARYADFRAVFYGNSTREQGQRVFQQIMDLCQGNPPSSREIDSHALLASRAGAQAVGMRIAEWANMEPAVKEEHTRS